jgi:hypothetical protein
MCFAHVIIKILDQHRIKVCTCRDIKHRFPSLRTLRSYLDCAIRRGTLSFCPLAHVGCKRFELRAGGRDCERFRAVSILHILLDDSEQIVPRILWL